MRLFQRSSRLVVAGSVVFFATLGWAQKTMRTEAEADRLTGPVKSVSTAIRMSGVDWQQPGGPTLLFPVACRECGYSLEGYRTRFGDIMDGKFVGETMALTLGAGGRVAEVLVTDMQLAQPSRRTVFGPFGMVEQTVYEMGKVRQTETFRYDQHGHRIESIAVDAAGDVISRSLTNYSKNGTFSDDTVWGKDQRVEERSTFDYSTGEQHFTAYNESGNVVQQWSVAHGQVTSYWDPPDSPRPFGISFADPGDGANVKFWSCHGGGVCEVSQVHYEFADAAKWNPTSAEWRDADGKLLYGVYYRYAFDQNGNWTHREVSVWNPDLGTPTQFEADDRLIGYWE